MCVMEVRPGQRSSTIAQAAAHNISTVERDLDMFEKLLAARGELVILDGVRKLHQDLYKVYAGLLEVFGEEVGREVQDWEGHIPHSEGNERSFIEQAHHDASLARRFETR